MVVTWKSGANGSPTRRGSAIKLLAASAASPTGVDSRRAFNSCFPSSMCDCLSRAIPTSSWKVGLLLSNCAAVRNSSSPSLSFRDLPCRVAEMRSPSIRVPWPFPGRRTTLERFVGVLQLLPGVAKGHISVSEPLITRAARLVTGLVRLLE